MNEEYIPQYQVVESQNMVAGHHSYAVVSRFGLRQQDTLYGWHSSAIYAYCFDKETAEKVAEALNVLLTLNSQLTTLDKLKINNACGRKVL